MAHFAKIDDDDKTVLNVEVIEDDVLDPNNTGTEDESLGVAFLANIHGWSNWKKTSYNTYQDGHLKGGTPFRGNFASIGGTYDSVNDIFLDNKYFPSWVLDLSKADWAPPVVYPTVLEYGDPVKYYMPSWDEDNQKWVSITPTDIHEWDPDTSSWSEV